MMTDDNPHMKQTSFAQVFAGAIAALSVMTALSAALGWAAPNLVRDPTVCIALSATPAQRATVALSREAVLCAWFAAAVATCALMRHGSCVTCCCKQISKKYTHYAAIGLFFFFGARSLWEAYSSSGGVRTVSQPACNPIICNVKCAQTGCTGEGI